MSKPATKPNVLRHFQRSSVAEFNFRSNLRHESISGTTVPIFLVWLLIISPVPATAHELSIYQSTVLASDHTLQQLGQSEPAGAAKPPECVAPEVTESAFDLATLPSVDSIDAQTDITVFFQSGVPAELQLAALRRAWTVDPAIRDFKGLQENDWNYNDLNSIPGFGELGPEVDVKIMVAQILGEAPRVAASPSKQLEEARSFSSLRNAVWRRFFSVAQD